MIFIIIVLVLICVVIIGATQLSSNSNKSKKSANTPRFTKTLFITSSQFESIKKQISEIIIDQSDIEDAINTFLCISVTSVRSLSYQVVNNDDPRTNFNYKNTGSITYYLNKDGFVKFLFKENNTLASKKLIQYFNDNDIKIEKLSGKRCFVILAISSVSAAFVDHVYRADDKEDVRKTFGWDFKCVKRNQRCRDIGNIRIQDRIAIPLRNNLYASNICGMYNRFSYDPKYVEPVRMAYNKTYTSLVLKGEIPARFKGEKDLLNLLVKKYPDVIFQYHPDWLKPLSLDFYIPSLNTAIEYQGEQHYRPINETAKFQQFYAEQLERDSRKKELCSKQNVRLLIWDYDLAITEENLDKIFNNPKTL